MLSKEYDVGHALNRSRIDIMENILRVANEGAGKTRILYRCNLSFEQLHVYLDFLVSKGLLKSVPQRTGARNGSKIYETTEKGQAFIQAYRSLTDLLVMDSLCSPSPSITG